MHNDFYIAFLSGWLVLVIFWSTIIIFVYFRNPPNSKLSRKTIFKSYVIFLILFMFILVFKYSDSFF